MKSLFGGELQICLSWGCVSISILLILTLIHSIARLMGESFKLHSQALIGYVDDLEASSDVSTPSMTSQGADEDSLY